VDVDVGGAAESEPPLLLQQLLLPDSRCALSRWLATPAACDVRGRSILPLGGAELTGIPPMSSATEYTLVGQSCYSVSFVCRHLFGMQSYQCGMDSEKRFAATSDCGEG
jgi:hypothetical protein